MSTVGDVVNRVNSRGCLLLKMAHNQEGDRNILTFADGSQATVTVEDGWTLRDREELWKGGAKV